MQSFEQKMSKQYHVPCNYFDCTEHTIILSFIATILPLLFLYGSFDYFSESLI